MGLPARSAVAYALASRAPILVSKDPSEGYLLDSLEGVIKFCSRFSFRIRFNSLEILSVTIGHARLAVLRFASLFGVRTEYDGYRSHG